MDFPDRLIGTQTLADGTTIVVYPPHSRKDVQELARQAFAGASTVKARAAVLKAYASRFPHCAWDQDSWLVPLWWEWRARRDKRAMTFLGALAAGVKSPASSWMDASQARAWRIRQAKLALARWRTDENLRQQYDDWVEGQHKSDPRETADYDQRHLRDLVARIKTLTGYRTTRKELQQRKLSGVLFIAAHKAFDVREHDLH